LRDVSAVGLELASSPALPRSPPTPTPGGEPAGCSLVFGPATGATTPTPSSRPTGDPNGFVSNRYRAAADRRKVIGGPNGFDDLLSDFRAALWLGELLIPAGQEVDLSSVEFDRVSTVFFSLFRPLVQA
jgi:hypothetical protein